MSQSQEMTDLQAAVTEEDSVVDSAVALLNGLAAQITAAAGDRAASTALAADVRTRAAALAAAVVANTPQS